MNSRGQQLEALKTANVKIYVAAAGAGAGIQKMLWGVPGASKFLAGASFPYSKEAFDEFVGYTPEHYVSRDSAIGLAIASYLKASMSCGEGQRAVGLGVTAAATTERERKGGRRIEAVVMTSDKVLAVSRTISNGARIQNTAELRKMDGALVSLAGIEMLFHAVFGDEHGRAQDITQAAREHFFRRPLFTRLGERKQMPVAGGLSLYPGNFNPPHAGHFGSTDETTLFQVTANTPHKPALSLGDMLQRVRDLKGKRDALFLEGAPLYIDKARLFPGSRFFIGADALERMLDPKWGADIKPMLKEFYDLNTVFLVAPRGRDTLQSVLDRHPEFAAFEAACTQGTGMFFASADMRFKDLSSTQIRAGRPWRVNGNSAG